MRVIFVSQCEKKAIKRTQQVLDAFADRIGDRAWQTMITEDGLITVKSLLRKTASKNTAVACHWIRSRSRSELMWIVGDRSKFNAAGVVAVNSTQKDILNSNYENDWRYLPLIKSLTALAALFHDWGKASDFFQNKLKKNSIECDPIRHEWVSVLLLKLIVGDTQNDKDDKEWLKRLSSDEFSIEGKKLFSQLIDLDKQKKVLENMPDVGQCIAWLILSHHRLPLCPKEGDGSNDWRETRTKTLQEMFKRIDRQWGYTNSGAIEQCFKFTSGLPVRSKQWLKQVQKWASKLCDCLTELQDKKDEFSQNQQSRILRVILQYARLSLMLGDHNYSSQNNNPDWVSPYNLLANTYDGRDKRHKKGEKKQKLDEHLIGVMQSAIKVVHFLPLLETKMPCAQDIKFLKKCSGGDFKWQDKAADEITLWKKSLSDPTERYGFFAVNMASTGKGKTFANAKVMQALSSDDDSLRYILALGLRTLTLQTGDEYRERIGFDKSELAVLIGSQAIMDLHEQNRQEKKQGNQAGDIFKSGSESVEELLDGAVDYELSTGANSLLENSLVTVLRDDKDRSFLYAPVLVCTIDHLMAATETKRGGHYILPALRLMSSDLVIDEIDDFDGNDLIAIGRLIHLAGMLGRKVMISSATIPPSLAEGYFNAYREGWLLFAKTRNLRPNIGCAWFDEFNSQVQNITETDFKAAIESYKQKHSFFVKQRAAQLGQVIVKRKAEIISCMDIKNSQDVRNDTTLDKKYFGCVQQAIIEKHSKHHLVDPLTGKKISFGLVRVANINPCVSLAKYLLSEAIWSDGIDVRVMAYHSQQVLLMRSEQEKHLDEVLKYRKNDEQISLVHPVIRNHINNAQTTNVIFILVATPIEEIGRDHDFDWAVVEPSSFRSIIQLAGRVLRHRDLKEPLTAPNIALMQYNLKGLQGENVAFHHPGYESKAKKYMLETHDLNKLVDGNALFNRVDAVPRILKNDNLHPHAKLIDLEHQVITDLLANYERYGPEALQGWLEDYWWLTAQPQEYIKFRQTYGEQLKLYLVPDEGAGREVFKEKDECGNFGCSVGNRYQITLDLDQDEKYSNSERLWLKRDYRDFLEKQYFLRNKTLDDCDEITNADLESIAGRYGEITISNYNRNQRYIYSSQLGLSESE